jgi:DHA2 family multidrug resistance protein
MNAAAAASDSPARRGLITVSIMLATIMQAVDTTIANVALPHMQGSLSATQEQIAWVLTSYIVAAAIMTAPTGFLASRFGRRRLFVIAVTGFTIASMLCGAATSLTEAVLFRVLQGMFGAGLVPLSQAVLLDTYPREKHGSAMAMWGVGVMVGPIVGPTLGGWLTDSYSWRWVFYINLPVGILALIGILAFVHETPQDRNRPFDFFGFALLSLAIGSLQMMLDRGMVKDWFDSPEIIAEAVIAGVALFMFLVQMFTGKRPFLTPDLFKDMNFVIGLLFMFVIGVVLLATLALLPPFCQTLLGYPVLTTGYVLAPRGVGTMIAMLVVGRIVNRVDPRLIIGCGIVLTAMSLWEMSGFTADVGIWMIIRTGIYQGLGLGFIFVPLTTIAFATLAPHHRNDGTAMFSLMRNVGSSIGISIVMSLLARNTQVNHATLAEVATPFNPMMHWPYLPHAWSLATTEGLSALNEQVTRAAQTIAYLDDFRLMMWVVLLAAPLLLLFRRSGGQRPVRAAA